MSTKRREDLHDDWWFLSRRNSVLFSYLILRRKMSRIISSGVCECLVRSVCRTVTELSLKVSGWMKECWCVWWWWCAVGLCFVPCCWREGRGSSWLQQGRQPGQTRHFYSSSCVIVMATLTPANSLSLSGSTSSTSSLWSWCEDIDREQWWKEADWWLCWSWSSWCLRQASTSTVSWVRWAWALSLSLSRRSPSPSPETRSKSSPPSHHSAFLNWSASSSLWRTLTLSQTPRGTSSLWSGNISNISLTSSIASLVIGVIPT